VGGQAGSPSGGRQTGIAVCLVSLNLIGAAGCQVPATASTWLTAHLECQLPKRVGGGVSAVQRHHSAEQHPHPSQGALPRSTQQRPHIRGALLVPCSRQAGRQWAMGSRQWAVGRQACMQS
jgi:hypothetical protein